MERPPTGADPTLRALLGLLEAEAAEPRWAAARVLSALRPSSPEAAAALARALAAGGDPRFRMAALEALGAIGGPTAVEAAIPLLEEEGDLGQRAMELVAGAGRPVLSRLRGGLGSAGEAARRRILAIAAKTAGAEGVAMLLSAIEHGHYTAVAEAGALASGTADGADRSGVVGKIEAFLAKGAPKDERAVPAALDLALRLAGPAALPLLLAYARPGHPPRVRRAALEAVARLPSLPGEAIAGILPFLREKDYGDVVAPASAALENAPFEASHAPALLAFLRGEDPALRRFAVSALGRIDTPQASAALRDVLLGPNPALREKAAAGLARQKAAPALALEALPQAADAEQARALVALLRPHAAKLKPAQWEPLVKRAAEWLEPGDERAESLVALVRERQPAAFLQACLDRARRLKKARRAGEIANLLRPFVKNGAASPEVRYEMAIAELMRGRRDSARESRIGHPGLLLLEGLFREPDFGLPGRIKREKTHLAPEEILLVACHFSEKAYAERAFGEDLLRWIWSTFPGENVAASAHGKLVMEGFPTPAAPAGPKPKPEAKPTPAAAKKPAKPAARLSGKSGPKPARPDAARRRK
jgi:HEAT repeat protein